MAARDSLLAIETAVSESALVATLRDVQRQLTTNPAFRNELPKAQLVQVCMAKHRASKEIWSSEVAQQFGVCLSSYAAAVYPKPAYEGQEIPPAYLYRVPEVEPPAYDAKPAPSAPEAAYAAGGAAAGAAAGYAVPTAVPVATPVATPAGDAAAEAAKAARAASDVPALPGQAYQGVTVGSEYPEFVYAPPPAIAQPLSEAELLEMGLPANTRTATAEYSLEFPDGAETTTGALPCKPENCHRVTHINLFFNDVKVIEGLERFPNLMRLTLKSNDIKSLRGVEKAPRLRWIDVSDNDITDLTGTARMQSLEWLNLANNDLKSLRGLEWCPRLTYVNLNNNDLTSVAGIDTLPALMKVDLCNNDLEHVRGLAGCKHLHEALLSSNHLVDVESILQLTTCRALIRVDIRDNRFSKADVKRIREHFRRELPTCELLTDEGKGGDCTIM